MGYDKAIKRLACSCGEEQACSPGSGSTSERRPDRKQGQSSMFSGADRMVRARDGSPGCPPGVWTRGRLARERRVCRESGVPWGSWGGAAPEDPPFSPSSWAGGISGSDQKCVRDRARAGG